MSDGTKIEWADSTFNPWIGCTKIAPACDHCYAADLSARYGWAEWGNHPRKRTSASTWQQPLKWQRNADYFRSKHGRRRRVFCASLADVFDNQVPDEWRADLWQLILDTPDIDWLLLTKRPQNIRKMLPTFWGDVRGHVWLGTTVEDQEHADRNIPHLLEYDAAVRFISAEPLLGPIDLTDIAYQDGSIDAVRGDLWGGSGTGAFARGLDWVIVGGESGPNARPMHPDWARALRDQCAAAGVAFFFKQWGNWVEWPDAEFSSEEAESLDVQGHYAYFQAHSAAPYVHMRHLPKAAAGRLLDGVEHNGMPEAA